MIHTAVHPGAEPQAVEALDGFQEPGFHAWLARELAQRKK